MQLTIPYHFDQATMLAYQKVVARRDYTGQVKRARRLYFLCGTFGILSGIMLWGKANVPVLAILAALIGLGFLSVFAFFFSFTAWRARKRMPAQIKELKLSFSEKSLGINNGMERADVPYNLFSGVCKTSCCYIIFQSLFVGYIIPKSCVPEEQYPNFSDFLEEKFDVTIEYYPF